MYRLAAHQHKQKCTLIQTMNGDVKLIKRSDDSPNDLETLRFPGLKECIEYVDKNQYEIAITHLGRKQKKTPEGEK